MSFDGNEAGSIPLTTAAEYTANYRDENPNSTNAHFFGKKIINDILKQTGCVGIRIYYGIDGNGAKQLILVGVNSSEDDLTNGIIGDNSLPCPTYCGRANELNS